VEMDIFKPKSCFQLATILMIVYTLFLVR